MSFFGKGCKFNFDNFLGWGLTTLALRFFNKRSDNDTTSDPDSLNVTETKLGSPIPVVMGTCLIKSPLISYFGDFEAKIYTEEYSAHANFNAWPLVFALIAQYISAPKTTTGVTTTNTGVWPIFGKDVAVGPLINSLFMWLLTWLINGRNLKTTVQKGFKYYLGYQQIICWSHPNARLKRVYMNEKEVWSGDEPCSNHTNGSPFVIAINDEELFGGPDENGGFVGELHVYFGGDNQGADQWMIDQMKADSIDADLRGYSPAYRPYISVVVPKAYVGKRSTIPTMWYEIEIIPNSLLSVVEDIGIDDVLTSIGTTWQNDTERIAAENDLKAELGDMSIGDDANAGDILNEIVYNNDWGLAEHYSVQNIASLIKLARTIKEEKAGLSIQLNSKKSASSIIEDVCGHINAIKYADETIGTVTYKLIRDDYLTDDTVIREINESNCSEITFVRQDWSNTISEISVNFTDREALYETGTVTDDDIANIEIQNGIKTTKSYDYAYFTTAANALWAARRQLTQEGYPLANVSLKMNRTVFDLRLGDVFKLNFKPYGIENMIFRINKVTHDEFESGVINIDAIEDVFALSKTIFNYSNPIEWQKPKKFPSGAQNFRFMEVPYEMTKVYYTYVYAYCCLPSSDTELWNVWRKKQGGKFSKTSQKDKWTASGYVVYDYPENTDAIDNSVCLIVREFTGASDIDDMYADIVANNGTGIVSARQGANLLICGDEIMAYSDMKKLANGNWQIEGIIRGTYDTVPQEHAALEEVFFIRSGHFANVTAGGYVCANGVTTTEEYNITCESDGTEENFDNSKIVSVTTKRRSECPSVQCNILISAFNAPNNRYISQLAGDITIDWTPRDKTLSYGCVAQDDIVDYWGKAAFATPSTVEYVTEVYVAGNKVHTDVGTNLSFSYGWHERRADSSDLVSDTEIVMFTRDTVTGLESYQKQVRKFKWIIPTVVGVVNNVNDALTLMSTLDNNGKVEILQSAYTNHEIIPYENLAIVLLGSQTPTYTAGSFIDTSGNYWLTNGTALLFSDKTNYTTITLPANYVIYNPYKAHAQVKRDNYLWDGTSFVVEP